MGLAVTDLAPGHRAALLGILNVTPDSFSDGGRWLSVDDAVRHGIGMTLPAGEGPASFGADLARRRARRSPSPPAAPSRSPPRAPRSSR